jgi:hypothetical protein
LRLFQKKVSIGAQFSVKNVAENPFRLSKTLALQTEFWYYKRIRAWVSSPVFLYLSLRQGERNRNHLQEVQTQDRWKNSPVCIRFYPLSTACQHSIGGLAGP